jgi:hypothetical protein
MKSITRTELVNRLRETDASASFVSIQAETDPRMRKTNNPFAGSVVKRATSRGLINFHYGNAVNNQREREGIEEEFNAQPRRWGTRIEKTPLIEHNGAFYIEVKVEGVVDAPTFINVESGEEIAKETLQEWLPARSKPTTQGTEKEIMVRDFKVDSITQINMYGEEFEVVNG